MTDWDQGTILSSAQGLPATDPDASARGEARGAAQVQSRLTARKEFNNFLRNYRTQDNTFIYRDALLRQHRRRIGMINVDLAHLSGYSASLHECITHQPNDFLPIFETAARDVLLQLIGEGAAADEDGEEEEHAAAAAVRPVQIALRGELTATSIRHITAAEVNKLIQVPGIVINASKTSPKVQQATLKCTACGNVLHVPANAGFGGFTMPRICNAMNESATGGANPGDQKCPIDPFVVLPDECKYVDQQTLKLQEAPEEVPTGEMPRHVLVSVERSLVDRVSPGTRVSLIGVSSIFQSANSRRGQGAAGVGVRQPYLRVVGIMEEESGRGRVATRFSPEEEAQFRAFAQTNDLYEKMAKNVAPAISGDYTVDIKKAVLALLMGGSRKLLPDGTRLRGDINVLLLGDPSTAKSQFLKFVERVAPVGVYTSGKGSSAAGLTASVIRDAKGEFYLEGGAMVLADGGVVCIDEFDKMREEDRVAIHEAMEQQTISVAKAGITTILNSRASVLAAANPVFGRYDDERSAAENIDFLPTILSRFDLIFIVRDVRNTVRDAEIARHVMRVHINASVPAGPSGLIGDEGAGGAADGGVTVPTGDDFDVAFMKRFVAFARAKCAPRLSQEAAESLQDKYVKVRSDQKMRHTAESAEGGGKNSVVPITVRQLEALVRISEAIAKVSLTEEVTREQVDEAYRLFQVSTLDAANSGMADLGRLNEQEKKLVLEVQKRIQTRIAVNAAMSKQHLVDDLLRMGFDSRTVNKAIFFMGNDLRLTDEGRRIERVR